jgi:hypothetical protein
MSKASALKYFTKAQASRDLGITRPTLDRILSRPGAPSPNAAKKYEASALSSFVESQRSSGLDPLRNARLREVELRCEKLRRELDLTAKKTILRADVDAFHGLLSQRLRSLLYFKLETELPPKLAGCDALNIRQNLRALADELVGRLAKDVDAWNIA